MTCLVSFEMNNQRCGLNWWLVDMIMAIHFNRANWPLGAELGGRQHQQPAQLGEQLTQLTHAIARE